MGADGDVLEAMRGYLLSTEIFNGIVKKRLGRRNGRFLPGQFFPETLCGLCFIGELLRHN
jgi:hypothetical protein